MNIKDEKESCIFFKERYIIIVKCEIIAMMQKLIVFLLIIRLLKSYSRHFLILIFVIFFLKKNSVSFKLFVSLCKK